MIAICILGASLISIVSYFLGNKVLTILSIVGFIIGTSSLFYFPETQMIHKFSKDIYSIEDNLVLEGSKYYFEEDFKYFYYTDYKDGKKLYSCDSKKAYIVEKTGVKPHIEYYQEEFITKNKIIRFFYDDYLLRKEYRIVVPPKTINEGYEIDTN